MREKANRYPLPVLRAPLRQLMRQLIPLIHNQRRRQVRQLSPPRKVNRQIIRVLIESVKIRRPLLVIHFIVAAAPTRWVGKVYYWISLPVLNTNSDDFTFKLIHAAQHTTSGFNQWFCYCCLAAKLQSSTTTASGEKRDLSHSKSNVPVVQGRWS